MIDNNTIEDECCELRTCENSFSGTCPTNQNLCKYTECGDTCDENECCVESPNICPCTNVITCSGEEQVDRSFFYNHDDSDEQIKTVCCVSPGMQTIDTVVRFDTCESGFTQLCSELADIDAVATEFTYELTGGDGLTENIVINCEQANQRCGGVSNTCSVWGETNTCPEGSSLISVPEDVQCITGCTDALCCVERFTNMEGFENYYLQENMNNIIEGVENSSEDNVEYSIPITISISPKNEDITISKTEIEQKLDAGIKLSMLSQAIKKINKKKEKQKIRDRNTFEIVVRMVGIFVVVCIVLFSIYKFKSKNPLEELLSSI
jgi:hypothetical protein